MDGCKMTAVQLAKAIRAGETTAVEAMQAVLEKIEHTDIEKLLKEYNVI